MQPDTWWSTDTTSRAGDPILPGDSEQQSVCEWVLATAAAAAADAQPAPWLLLCSRRAKQSPRYDVAHEGLFLIAAFQPVQAQLSRQRAHLSFCVPFALQLLLTSSQSFSLRRRLQVCHALLNVFAPMLSPECERLLQSRPLVELSDTKNRWPSLVVLSLGSRFHRFVPALSNIQGGLRGTPLCGRGVPAGREGGECSYQPPAIELACGRTAIMHDVQPFSQKSTTPIVAK